MVFRRKPLLPEMGGAGDEKAEGCAEAVGIFARQVLVFPLLATALAIVALVFGGRCAAWQWWGAVAAVVGAPLLKRERWRTALGAAGMFAVLLLSLRCLLPPLAWDSTEFFDMPTYHLPTAQLLIEGWNPMADPMAEGICGRLGLDVWGMAPVQVAFMPKALAIFAAVAYQFVGDPTGLTVPGLALLWLGVALQALRATRGLARMAALAALVWILPLVHGRVHVDLALAFAVCGLLFAMAECLKGKSCDWLSLAVWTIWMMNTKLNGVLAAFVFWVLFAGAILWKHRMEWRQWVGWFGVFAAGVTLAWGLFSWNPMVTSVRLCGNPFYPFATLDEEKWPVKDLTWDLRLVNDDMRQMGKAGIWVHEYVSPELARAYCRWKMGRETFQPERTWYSKTLFMGDRVRWCMWAVFLLLMLHPQGRLFALGGLLLSFFVPKEAVGYMRYAPWMSSLACLAVTLQAEWLETRTGRRVNRVLGTGALAAFTVVGLLWLWLHARDVEFKAAELDAPRTRIHSHFFSVQPPEKIDPHDFTVLYDYLTVMDNQCRLLAKELGWEADVLPASGWQNDKEKNLQRWTFDQRQWLLADEERDGRDLAMLGEPWLGGNVWDGWNGPENAERWIRSPWYFWVPLSEAQTIVEYYTFAEPRDGESAGRRQLRRIKAAAHAWCVTYPREVWKRLAGRKQGA